MLVQAGFCQTCSETTLLVFPRGGSYNFVLFQLVAVAARDQKRAQTFADKLGFKKAYGSYEEFYNDPEVNKFQVSCSKHP